MRKGCHGRRGPFTEFTRPPELSKEGAPAETTESAACLIDLRLVAERQDFDALEAEWNELFIRSAGPTHVFQSFNFCWHWANHYLGSSPRGISGLNLSVVTGRRNGRLVMVWPLACERVRGITQTFWMGDPVSQYGDVLIDADVDALPAMRAALDFLHARTNSNLLRLRRVRSDSNVAPLIPSNSAIPQRHARTDGAWLGASKKKARSNSCACAAAMKRVRWRSRRST